MYFGGRENKPEASDEKREVKITNDKDGYEIIRHIHGKSCD